MNVKGPFQCALAVLPSMREQNGGLLIHVASVAGTGIFPVSGPSYTASKHAARAMSATINAEEGIHGIRSVCINPGEVATPILDTRPQAAQRRGARGHDPARGHRRRRRVRRPHACRAPAWRR